MLLLLLNTTHFDEFIDNIEKASKIALSQTAVRRRKKIYADFEFFYSGVINELKSFPRSDINPKDSEVLLLLDEIKFVNSLFREFVEIGVEGFKKAINALKIATQSLIDFTGDKLQKLWTLAQELLDLISLLTSN